MSLDYIRTYYSVPAEIGGRVRYAGGKSPSLGTITGSQNAHLLIKLDGELEAFPYHPTWNIEYLDNQPPQTRAAE